MEQSHDVGWGSQSPTPVQLKEFFAQVENGRITKEYMGVILQGQAMPSILPPLLVRGNAESFPGINQFVFGEQQIREANVNPATDGEMYDLLGKTENNVPGKTIASHVLQENALGHQILSELGQSAITSLFHVYSAIKTQAQGGKGLLLADNINVNLFFVKDARDCVRILAAEYRHYPYYHYWVVHTHYPGAAIVWVKGYQVISSQ